VAVGCLDGKDGGGRDQVVDHRRDQRRGSHASSASVATFAALAESATAADVVARVGVKPYPLAARTTDMEIHEATPEDGGDIRAVALASLHASYDDILGEETVDEAFENWYDPDVLRLDLESDDLAFVIAEDDDDVVGFSHVHVRDRQEEGRIQWLHVHPDHRGGGVGSRLLEHTRDVLHARAIEHVSGEVLADNVAGNEFYRDHGFSLRDQYTVQVGGRFVAENVYDDASVEPADLEPLETEDGTMHVDVSDEHRGKLASWYPVYGSEDGTRRYGWYCGNCESVDNAMDAMGRVQCNACDNARKPERWDAAYL
jgi:ribosomal protein S18 acetylase RimI-like enzyme